MIEIHPTGVRLHPEPSRVIARPYLSGTGGLDEQKERLQSIADRVIRQSPSEITESLDRLRRQFAGRHRDLEATWTRSLNVVVDRVPGLTKVSDPSLQLLLGATFTHEYAIEGAALTNPSIVGIGESEFILSLRAIGEGHISAIEFRTGRRRPDGGIEVDPPGPYAAAGTRSEVVHNRNRFAAKLEQMKAEDEIADMILDLLGDTFSSSDLAAAIERVTARDGVHPLQAETTLHMFRWLASSNYELVFEDQPLSERVLFPAGPADSNGMEDARFVRFVDTDDSVTFFATYTAFDGTHILPQLIATSDFVRFSVSTLHGSCAQNKGMALFPRKIDGKYFSLSRHDQTNLYVLWTDDVWQWNNAERLTGPLADWEALQIGNCGSPIETEAGWLVITHGVGPMRVYRLGALLLDLAEPDRIIGRLKEPLLSPDWADRDGYVPNVVYSCGALLDDGQLILPYGISDREVGIGTIAIDHLLEALA